jgi:antirestriction protein ArdC
MLSSSNEAAEAELKRLGSPKRSKARKKTLSEDERKEYRAKINAQVEELDRHILEAIDNPEIIDQWVAQMRSGDLWRYSYGNLCLARSQARARGIDLTRLAGFKRFEQLGYRVSKGQSGLKILAPKSYVRKDKKTGKPLLDDKGNKLRGTYFGTVSVFDISQCEPILDDDGKPTNVDLHSTPAAEQALLELSTVAREQGIELFLGGASAEESEHADSLNALLSSSPSTGGFYTELGDQKTPTIVTRPGLGPAEEARVLAHELGHALMHSGRAGYKDHDDRVRKEAEAESAAYVLMGQYGLESEDQALYVSHWVRSLDSQLKTELEAEGLSGARLERELAERKKWLVRDTMGNIQSAVRTVMERAQEIRGQA